MKAIFFSFRHFIVIASLFAGAVSLRAQGTAFTYQGRLTDNAAPFNGNAEFQATLWSAASGGTALATNSPASVIVGVTNGLFVLPLDFGANFPGAERWLELEVRTTIGSFTLLSPRQQLTPTPYAITASNVTGTLPAAQLSGTVLDARLSTNVSLLGQSIDSSEITDGTIVDADISLSAAIADSKLATITTGGKVANSATTASSVNTPLAIVARDGSGNFTGGTVTAAAFSGSGAALTSLNANNLSSGTVPDARLSANVARTNQVWLLSGNAGTSAGTHFLGTTDDEPLELKVNGQRGLRIEPNINAAPNVIGGSPNNVADAGVVGAFIGGGGATNHNLFGRINHTNRIASSYGTIAGGIDNLIHTNARSATIGGGEQNEIVNGGTSSVIAGGSGNTISDAGEAFIGGGGDNIVTNSIWAFLGAGVFNSIINGSQGVIGGGEFNKILSQSGGTIGGGILNQLGGTNIAGSSSGTGSNAHNTIVGGILNWIAAGASHSFIGGGRSNFIANGANFAAVPGGRNNRAAGDYSFAAGRLAKADHDGAFVWADSQDAIFGSTDTNQFLIRASGGVGIGTNAPASALHINGTVTISSGDLSMGTGGQILADSGSNVAPGISFRGDPNTGIVHPAANTLTFVTLGSERVRIESGGNVGIGTNNPVEKLHVIGNILLSGTVTQNSDRNAKTDIRPVDTAAVLDRVTKMPIQQWRFKAETGNVKHIGPMAQDFHAAFGLGARENGIATVDADGVALAAIQGLNQKLEEKEARINELERRLAALEKLLEKRN